MLYLNYILLHKHIINNYLDRNIQFACFFAYSYIFFLWIFILFFFFFLLICFAELCSPEFCFFQEG